MAYRRRSAWSSSYNNSYDNKTKITIQWSNKSGAYSISFSNMFHYTMLDKNGNKIDGPIKILHQYMKNLGYGNFDFDPDTKTWFLQEKFIDGFKTMAECFPEKLEVDFTKKPDNNQTFQNTFIPTAVYLDRFKNISGVDISGLVYDQAKKEYRRVCMRLHPDRGGDPKVMSELNESWSALEVNHFKIKKEVDYEQVSTTAGN